MLQKKLKASCTAKSTRPRVRRAEGGQSQIRAAPTPINANRMPQTMGKTMPGGDRGGFTMAPA